MTLAAAPGSDDAVSLTERLRLLQILRFAFIAGILCTRLLAPDVVGGELRPLLIASAAYAGWCVASELAWRAWGRRGLVLLSAMLLVDGVFLAAAQQLTVDPAGVVRLLLVPHVVAVTLVASYRTGLKVALWHSLLLYSAHQARATDLLTQRPTGAEPYGELVAFAALLWLVTLTTAIFSAVNERELRRRRIDVQALADMAAELEHESGPSAIADVLLATVIEEFGYRRGAVIGLRAGALSLLATRGVATTEVTLTDQGVLARARTGGTVLVRALDPTSDAELVALLPMAVNVVRIPLVAEGATIGALVLERGAQSSARLDRRALAMTEQMASYVALALRNAWLVEDLRELAETDALTQLRNRRSFDAALARDVSRSARSGAPVSLLMIDIDHFKRVNDTRGHQIGDRLLRDIAGILRTESRAMDEPARYGGEEFAVILPDVDTGFALEAADRLRCAIEDAATVVPITVSIGVATYPAHGTDAATLVRAADTALYAAKDGGRNRVAACSTEASASAVSLTRSAAGS